MPTATPTTSLAFVQFMKTLSEFAGRDWSRQTEVLDAVSASEDAWAKTDSALVSRFYDDLHDMLSDRFNATDHIYNITDRYFARLRRADAQIMQDLRKFFDDSNLEKIKNSADAVAGFELLAEALEDLLEHESKSMSKLVYFAKKFTPEDRKSKELKKVTTLLELVWGTNDALSELLEEVYSYMDQYASR